MSLDLAAYLARIGHAGPVAPDLATLNALHWAHLQALPFENLDIRPLRRPIGLEPEALAAKLLPGGRGGFCYELNGLLALALERIGFGVDRLSAQFVREGGDLSPPFDHMLLRVTVPGEPHAFLADVGGAEESPAYPLPLLHDQPVTHAETGRAYRHLRAGDGWRQEYRLPAGDWKPMLVFTETPYAMAEFADRSCFQQTHPDSFFTKAPLCSHTLPGGRVTVTGTKLIETRGGERTETPLVTDAAFAAALRTHFGIDLGPFPPIDRSTP